MTLITSIIAIIAAFAAGAAVGRNYPAAVDIVLARIRSFRR